MGKEAATKKMTRALRKSKETGAKPAYIAVTHGFGPGRTVARACKRAGIKAPATVQAQS